MDLLLKEYEMNTDTDRCPWCGSAISHAKFVEIETRIKEQNQRKLAEAEAAQRKRLEEKFSQELETQKRAAEKLAAQEAEKRVAKLAAERNLAVQKAKELEAKEATVRRELQEQAERQLQKELDQQRLILEKAKDQEVLKKQVEFSREREGWQRKVLEFEKKLQQKTANEIGEGAEVDVYEVLKEAFPHDHITRVAKGQPGADIHHQVMYKGECCGRIIVDSKNRQGWQNAYVTKLREDQTEAKADQAILATTVFPSGQKELAVESGVILVNPARVKYVVGLLRNAIVRMHIQGLSTKERTGKMNQLYNFITSEAFARRLKEATQLTDDILELDVQEQQSHRNVWKKRGTMATRLNNVLRELDTEISAIVESGVGSEVPAA